MHHRPSLNDKINVGIWDIKTCWRDLKLRRDGSLEPAAVENDYREIRCSFLSVWSMSFCVQVPKSSLRLNVHPYMRSVMRSRMKSLSAVWFELAHFGLFRSRSFSNQSTSTPAKLNKVTWSSLLLPFLDIACRASAICDFGLLFESELISNRLFFVWIFSDNSCGKKVRCVIINAVD
jgi:hypothetical protein